MGNSPMNVFSNRLRLKVNLDIDKPNKEITEFSVKTVSQKEAASTLMVLNDYFMSNNFDMKNMYALANLLIVSKNVYIIM